MTTALRRDAWYTHAACAGQDTALWFPKQPAGSPAMQTCRTCPVRAECLLEALQEEGSTYAHRYGIRGGLTSGQRRLLPPLPASRPTALDALRSLLDALDDQPHTEGTDQRMTTTDAPAATQEQTTVSSLLRWAEEHHDTEVQAQGARAEAALTGLRTRYAADQELTAITTEAEQLEKRLAELRAREQQLAPTKPKKRTQPTRDYDSRTVRAWADANGIECARIGQIPRRVLDAWRASLPQST